MHRLAILSTLLLGLAACGTTQASLPYSPVTPPVVRSDARPVVALGSVIDRREDGQEDPNYIGTIRGGFGNPIKRLDAPQPVTEVVRKAFSDALAARGLLAVGTPRYELSVEILALSADQMGRREGRADFRITLAPAGSGAPVLADRASANRISGSVITFEAGIFGSVEQLQVVAQQAMTEAIDKLLDNPRFAAALR